MPARPRWTGARVVRGSSRLIRTTIIGEGSVTQHLVYLGPEGSYGHCVAEELNANAYHGVAKLLGMESHEKILDALDQDATENMSGIVAMYNSTQGPVQETIRYWMARENHRERYLDLGASFAVPNLLHVIGKISLRIHHQLLVHDPTVRLDQISRVVSHPQALAQCSKMINAVLKDVVREPVRSTAAAAQIVAETGDHSFAALSSRFCANLYGLHVLQPDFEDDTSGNYTHFYWVRNGTLAPFPLSGDNGTRKIGLLLWPKANAPGVLHHFLSPIAAVDMNMTYQTSILLGGVDDKVAFFMEMNAHENPLVTSAVITLLAEMSEKIVMLGVFPTMVIEE